MLPQTGISVLTINHQNLRASVEDVTLLPRELSEQGNICQSTNLKHAAACGAPSTFSPAFVPHILQPIMFQLSSEDGLLNESNKTE